MHQTHPNFAEIRDLLMSDDFETDDIAELMDVRASISRRSHGSIVIEGDQVLYRGQLMHGLLSQRLAQWGPVVAAEAGVREGDRVLDVACGTGALTLAAARIAGPSGSVVGLDPNPEMLAVARRKTKHIEWLEGKAEDLPLPDNCFDALVSQFGFMFFDDKPQALREMVRVLKPGGRLAVAVCDAVENSPGYGAFAQLLDRLFGKKVGDAFRAPFSLGDAGRLHELCREAGIADAEVVRRNGKVSFNSIDDLVSTERACVWTLGGVLTNEQFQRLLEASESTLNPFVTEGGTVEFDMPSLIIRAQSRAG